MFAMCVRAFLGVWWDICEDLISILILILFLGVFWPAINDIFELKIIHKQDISVPVPGSHGSGFRASLFSYI